MKRKLTLALLAAIIAVLVLTGAAVAVGMNLFERFGKYDERLMEIAPEAGLASATPETVHTDALGDTKVTFDSAYYDGQGLIVALTMENSARVEGFEPTPDELARMKRMDEGYELSVMQEDLNDADIGVLRDFGRAVERGTPAGYVHYNVYLSDHSVTGDGVDLPARSERMEMTEDGRLCVLREFEMPLPEGARDRDALDVHIALYEGATYVYFDGGDYYTRYDVGHPAGEIAMAVKRTDAVTRAFAGEGTLAGVPVTVEATASAIHAKLHVACVDEDSSIAEALDAVDPTDEWGYEVNLFDEAGNRLRIDQTQADDRVLEIEYDGTGRLPEALEVALYVDGEAGRSPNARPVGEPIKLLPAQ